MPSLHHHSVSVPDALSQHGACSTSYKCDATSGIDSQNQVFTGCSVSNSLIIIVIRIHCNLWESCIAPELTRPTAIEAPL